MKHLTLFIVVIGIVAASFFLAASFSGNYENPVVAVAERTIPVPQFKPEFVPEIPAEVGLVEPVTEKEFLEALASKKKAKKRERLPKPIVVYQDTPTEFRVCRIVKRNGPLDYTCHWE